MKAATIIFSPNGGISLIESFALVCMFAHTNLITYESLYSSSYLLNKFLLYDKLWGPSQRVVTLFPFNLGIKRKFLEVTKTQIEKFICKSQIILTYLTQISGFYLQIEKFAQRSPVQPSTA